MVRAAPSRHHTGTLGASCPVHPEHRGWGRAGSAHTAFWGLSASGGLGRQVGLTPGSGRHPGSAVHLLVLPDVILLVIIKGLDVVTAAGLKQSCAGTVLVSINAEVDLRDPIKGSTATREILSTLTATRAARCTGYFRSCPWRMPDAAAPPRGNTAKSKGVDSSAGSDRPRGYEQMGASVEGGGSLSPPPSSHTLAFFHLGPLCPWSAR